MRGGYNLINLKGTVITVGDSGETVSGVYAAIENAKKHTILTGLVSDSKTFPDIPVTFSKGENVYTAVVETTFTDSTSDTVVGLVLSVTNADVVSLAAVTITGAAG